MSTPNLIIPNELEAHMIAVHRIEPGTIALYRKHCKKNGKNYDEFLETSHALMHEVRRDDAERST